MCVVIIAKGKITNTDTDENLLHVALLVVTQFEPRYWIVCLNGRFKVRNSY